MQEVSGSIPLSSTKFQTLAAKRGFFVSAFCRFCNTVYILAVPCGECITDCKNSNRLAPVCFAMRINLLFVCLKTPISESSVLMFVEHNLIKNIKIFTLAFTLTVVLIQLSRLISPLAVIHSNYIFLAWMPLCVMLSILFIFG